MSCKFNFIFLKTFILANNKYPSKPFWGEIIGINKTEPGKFFGFVKFLSWQILSIFRF